LDIRVKLFAMLRYGRGKEQILSLAPPVKKDDILRALDLVPEDIAIFYVNGRTVDDAYEIREDDVLSLFPPAGGG
jgi:molybdopterin synthase sulfur carrier subunit